MKCIQVLSKKPKWAIYCEVISVYRHKMQMLSFRVQHWEVSWVLMQHVCIKNTLFLLTFKV